MTPEELEEALGLTPQFDIPAAARRSTRQVGLLASEEGGFAPGSLARQSASLVRAVLEKNNGNLVSRWGHILLRRALVSRFDSPADLDPGDFLAMRVQLLLRMGEAEAARAMVQDLDSGNFTLPLTDAAFDAYVATGDFTGICPVMRTQADARDDAQWETAGNICQAFRGNSRGALRNLDRALRREEMPQIDLLLAQKYAGAAGNVRRAVTIEWDDVDGMNPWRHGMALAVGLEPPQNLVEQSRDARLFEAQAALSPALGLASRARAADVAAAAGVLSSEAMVDLYSQIYAAPDVEGEWNDRAERLRGAYVLADPAARLSAMQELWNETDNATSRYARQVLTAFAAARLPVADAFAQNAGDLIASMLTAGLDRDAAQWAETVDDGSLGWALVQVSRPGDTGTVDTGDLDTFFDNDESSEARKSAFLLAGLAGLGRIGEGDAADFASSLDIDLTAETRWTRILESAVNAQNPAMVALLASLGMQGGSWDKMTPRYLYRIVSALRRSGMEAEARMIAAEAVARG